MSDELTDAEYEEAKRNHQILKDAYAKNPEATLQAMKDAMRSDQPEGSK